MLEKMILNDYGAEKDYNCAEKILAAGNVAYALQLPENIYKLASSFGGGMARGKTCGAVVSALMTLGWLNAGSVAHKSPELKTLVIKYQELFEERMGGSDCVFLKDRYFNDTIGCKKVILEAAKLLDELVDV